MDEKIKVKAEELAQLLADSEVYKRVEQARADIAERSAAQVMLRDFAFKQQRLQEKSAAGQEISEKELKELEQAWQVIGMNPYVSEYVHAEQMFVETWMGVMGILSKAVGLDAEPEALDDAENEEIPEQKTEEQSAKSRLWVPGDQ